MAKEFRSQHVQQWTTYVYTRLRYLYTFVGFFASKLHSAANHTV